MINQTVSLPPFCPYHHTCHSVLSILYIFLVFAGILIANNFWWKCSMFVGNMEKFLMAYVNETFL